jgi:hypothetical protein
MLKDRTKITLATLILLGMTAPGRADYVSRTYTFDRSSLLPAGIAYGTVTIEAYDGKGDPGNGLTAGQVRLTLQADPLPIYGPVSDSFGFRSVGFNTDLTLQESQITTPAGWQVRTGRHMGGFGLFGWQAYAKSHFSQNPLVVTISGLGADAAFDHFLIPSATSTGDIPLNGPVYFAARIGGFDLNDDTYDARSHVVGNAYPILPPVIDDPWPLPDDANTPPSGGDGPPPTPEPATWLLGMLGCGGFGLGRWLGRRAYK